MFEEMDFNDLVFMICFILQIASIICFCRYFDYRSVKEFYLLKDGIKVTHSFWKNIFMIYFIQHLIGIIIYFFAYWYIFDDFIIMIPIGIMCFTAPVFLRLLNGKRCFGFCFSIFLFFILLFVLGLIAFLYCSNFAEYHESFYSTFHLYLFPMFSVLLLDYDTYLEDIKN